MVHPDSAGYIQALYQVNITCSQTWLVLEWKFHLMKQILSSPLTRSNQGETVCHLSYISLILPRTTLDVVLGDAVMVWIQIEFIPAGST